MDAFTMHKYATSLRESELRKVAQVIRLGQTDSLFEACYMVGIEPTELTKKEVNFIKKLVG